MASSKTDSTVILITCVICHELFDDPRLLPCSHTYCRKCIEQMAAVNKDRFECPLRDGTFIAKSIIDLLPPNQVARDLVELYSATDCSVQCTNCQSKAAQYGCDRCENESFCSECYETVHASRVMQKHARFSLAEEPLRMNYCDSHVDEKLKYWCVTCGILICSDCKHLKHIDHQHDFLPNVYKEIKAKMQQELRTIQSTLDHRLDMAQGLLNATDNHIKTNTGKIKEVMSSLRQVIDDHEKKMLEQILTIETKQKKQIETSKKPLRNEMQCLTFRKALLEKLLDAKDHNKLLNAKRGFDEYVKKTNESLKVLPTSRRNFYQLMEVDQLQVLKEKILQCGQYVIHTNPKLEKKIVDNHANRQLDLTGDQLICQDMAIVADEIRNTTTLSSLLLPQNKIGDQGLQYLADAIKHNTTLSNFRLSQNQIGNLGVQHLADALKHNSKITMLHLQHNRIGDQGAQHLADALKQNKTLTLIFLDQNQLGNPGVQYLADALRQNTKVNDIRLSQNRINDQGIRYLADALKQNTTIRNLYLCRNQIGDAGAQYLADALRHNTTLKDLRLSHNEIGDQGAIHLVHALTQNKTLTGLVVEKNKINPETIQYAKETLKKTKLKSIW